MCHLLIYAGLNSSGSIVVPRRREDVGERGGGAAATALGAKEAFAYDNWACDMMSEEEEGVEAMASFTDDKMKEESGDEEESNNNELTMPKRKLKDPAPVWKHCATRLPDGKGKCGSLGSQGRVKEAG